jgi:hypothetical protein
MYQRIYYEISDANSYVFPNRLIPIQSMKTVINNKKKNMQYFNSLLRVYNATKINITKKRRNGYGIIPKFTGNVRIERNIALVIKYHKKGRQVHKMEYQNYSPT